jgi:hypothetical protein
MSTRFMGEPRALHTERGGNARGPLWRKEGSQRQKIITPEVWQYKPMRALAARASEWMAKTEDIPQFLTANA